MPLTLIAMADRLVFDHTIEGLFVRGLAGQMTPRLKEKLRLAGVDLEHKLLPAYPFDTWTECIGVAARELYPDRPETEGWRLLGERLVEGYQETVLGGSMFAMLKALGPRRMLARAQKSFRSGNNYSEVRVKDLAPTVMELWMNDPGMLRYFVQGVFLAALRASGAPGCTVDIIHADEQGTTYRASWRD
ncbi:DUF2378 family protein [Hyalangium gracile]|uniref:DUF2378 family protein n=1 Tax=Hyalangium gracile TaxID=394092 RepID=UPI00295E6596|nr:DUF2378 family protein [Hyalangium gracile]